MGEALDETGGLKPEEYEKAIDFSREGSNRTADDIYSELIRRGVDPRTLPLNALLRLLPPDQQVRFQSYDTYLVLTVQEAVRSRDEMEAYRLADAEPSESQEA